MMMVRGKYLIMLLLVMMCVASSCSKDEEPVEKERPMLSASSLMIEVGDSAVLQVVNADSINMVATTNSSAVSLRVEGNEIMIKALAEGTATVKVYVSGARLECDVTVTKNNTPQYDFSQELLDERCRFVSPSLSMYYDTPGTIFSIAVDGTIEVRSLITGDLVKFTPGVEKLVEGNLEKASLQVNGNNIAIKRATLYRRVSDSSMWFHLIDETENNIVLVVTDI